MTGATVSLCSSILLANVRKKTLPAFGRVPIRPLPWDPPSLYLQRVAYVYIGVDEEIQIA